jgi:hypothetical protein
MRVYTSGELSFAGIIWPILGLNLIFLLQDFGKFNDGSVAKTKTQSTIQAIDRNISLICGLYSLPHPRFEYYRKMEIMCEAAGGLKARNLSFKPLVPSNLSLLTFVVLTLETVLQDHYSHFCSRLYHKIAKPENWWFSEVYHEHHKFQSNRTKFFKPFRNKRCYWPHRISNQRWKPNGTGKADPILFVLYYLPPPIYLSNYL